MELAFAVGRHDFGAFYGEKMKLSKLLPFIAAPLLAGTAMNAQAALYTSSLGNLVTGYVQNDDSYFGAVNIGFDVNFFGTSYNQFYVSNNGNVTFGGGTRSFTPSPLNSQSTLPMIAPYWTDLDSRSGGAAGVYLSQTANQTIVTWSQMGYFSYNYSGLVTFQLVLNKDGTEAQGEGDIGFFYDTMTSGSDGHQVTAGFGDGLAAVNAGEISYASGTSANVSSLLSNSSVWFNLANGTPVQQNVPEPASLALFGAGLVGLVGARRKLKKS